MKDTNSQSDPSPFYFPQELATPVPGKQAAFIITVAMGLGHNRAAYPLKDIAYNGILLHGSAESTDREEVKLWEDIKKTYYTLSRIEKFPIVGKYLFGIILSTQKILPYYPKRDLSKPNWAIKYLDYMINKKNLCNKLIDKIRNEKIPVINTFYATGIAIDHSHYDIPDNYIIICDVDVNRVWVPKEPDKSNIKYLAPTERSKERLISYGILEKNIMVTGFPLPKENIGNEKKLEILKKDLFHRLLRLDPDNKFFPKHKKSIAYHLKRGIPNKRPDCFNLMFAIGGAGAQYDMAKNVLYTLRNKIKQKKINFFISLGIRTDIYNDFIKFVSSLNLSEYLDNSIKVIYDFNVFRYFVKFSQMLHETDIIWTKPSEMSFYCGLGIPILMAPPIGTHEEENKKWLIEIHAGIEPQSAVKYCDEWLFDMRKRGVFAEAAWDGFLSAPKLGTYNIEKIIADEIKF